MTLAVGVAVPEGLVIGADSRMTYINPRQWPLLSVDRHRPRQPVSAGLRSALVDRRILRVYGL